MIRKATCSDIPAFKKIWKDVFGDTDSFINWFFTQRFVPHMSFVYEKNGQIASLMHTYPIQVRLGNKTASAVMVSGVATLPDFRGQGLMHKLFLYAQQELSKEGHYLCYYYPANPDFYKSLGHVQITENLLFENVSSSQIKKSFRHTELNFNDFPYLNDLYNKFSDGFSGVVLRDHDFETKMHEYVSENLNVAINLNAYIIYHQAENSIEISEIGGRHARIHELLHSFELPIKGKFPPDFPTHGLNGEFTKSYGNMGGIMNMQKFLSETRFECPLLIEITDNSIPENNGIFDFNGNRHNKKADVSMTSGELLQTVAGYKIHPELKAFFSEFNCFSQDLY